MTSSQLTTFWRKFFFGKKNLIIINLVIITIQDKGGEFENSIRRKTLGAGKPNWCKDEIRDLSVLFTA